MVKRHREKGKRIRALFYVNRRTDRQTVRQIDRQSERQPGVSSMIPLSQGILDALSLISSDKCLKLQNANLLTFVIAHLRFKLSLSIKSRPSSQSFIWNELNLHVNESHSYDKKSRLFTKLWLAHLPTNVTTNPSTDAFPFRALHSDFVNWFLCSSVRYLH